MSDIEEPPKKVTKFEMESQYLEGEVMDEGQEEWLSEGILTDDDYNPAMDQSDSNLGNTSQDETMASADNSMEKLDNTDSQDTSTHSQENSIGAQSNGNTQAGDVNKKTENIEETLNNLENAENNNKIDLPDELDTFLIRKTDGKVLVPNKGEETPKETKESDIDESVKQSDDDGNDTDDLLRMLGDGDEKNKQQTANEKDEDGDSSDEDEYIFEGAKVKTLKLATSALMKKYPAAKAVPEDDDVTDASSDEAMTMKKIFGVPQSNTSDDSPVKTTPASKTSQPAKQPVVKIIRQPDMPKNVQQASMNKRNQVQRTPPQRIQPKRIQPERTQPTRTQPQKTPPVKTQSQKTQLEKTQIQRLQPKRTQQDRSQTERTPPQRIQPKRTQPDRTQPQKTQESQTRSTRKSEMESELEEIINEEEFLEEDEIDLDDDFTERPGPRAAQEAVRAQAQRIMRPERMDEEVPTDADTDSEDESLYDELPSSDSEDLDEWFTLDIRAERAGDYLPLLGDKAHQLLLDEKRRVSERLATLKQSLSSLTDSGKVQAEQLRKATVTLAELDTMLKAT